MTSANGDDTSQKRIALLQRVLAASHKYQLARLRQWSAQQLCQRIDVAEVCNVLCQAAAAIAALLLMHAATVFFTKLNFVREGSVQRRALEYGHSNAGHPHFLARLLANTPRAMVSSLLTMALGPEIAMGETTALQLDKEAVPGATAPTSGLLLPSELALDAEPSELSVRQPSVEV